MQACRKGQARTKTQTLLTAFFCLQVRDLLYRVIKQHRAFSTLVIYLSIHSHLFGRACKFQDPEISSEAEIVDYGHHQVDQQCVHSFVYSQECINTKHKDII